MHIFRKSKEHKTKALLLLVIIFLIFGCTKMKSNSDELSSLNIGNSKEFFKIPPSTDPLVLRVINDIKIRNEKKEFVNDFASKYGYPVWDKVIIKVSKNNAQSFANNLNENDTTLLIPFALVNQNKVNGFIRANLSDSIMLSFSLAQDYKNYTFSNSTTQTTASQFALQVMILNKLVFGVNEYTILDPRLFSTDTLHHKTKKITLLNPAPQNSLLSSSCWTLIQDYTVCTTPYYPACVNAPGGCDLCIFPTCYSTTTITTECPESGGNGSSGSNGTPSGTPTTGGGQIPYVYPCNPYLVGPSLTGNPPLPPCPPPTGGTGWSPSPVPLVTPCDKIGPLKNSALFKTKFTELQQKTSLSYESAFSFEDCTFAPSYLYADGQGKPKGHVRIPTLATGTIAGSAHAHYAGMLPIFSVGDLQAVYEIIELYSNAYQYSYTYSLTTSRGNSYVIVIDDIAKFQAFGENYFNNDDKNEKLEAIYSAYNIGGFPLDLSNPSNNIKNEAAFLKMLSDKNAGLTVLRPTQNLNNYSVLKWQSPTSVIEIPCN